MSEQLRNEGLRRRSHQAALRTWGLYLLSLVAWVTAVLALIFVGFLVCSQFTWYESSFLYRLFSWVRDYIFFVGMAAVLAGWVVISYQFIGKMARDSELLLAGAEELAQPGADPIRLPPGLKRAEDQLNLARERAFRAAQAAREAEQRKNDLVVYLAHDLKTPLTSVIGYLTLLRDEPELPVETRARYTGVVLDKAERLEDLINEFFEITRFSLTHLTLELSRINLSRMLEQMVFEFGPMLAEKELECRLDVPPDVFYECDPDKLQRVFDNLLRNAVSYSQPGGDINIRLRQQEGRLYLSVQNFGVTIPEDKLERIFDQFFRLDSARATRSGGAGLGLAIAKEIVELHGGTISAESSDGQVTFTVVL